MAGRICGTAALAILVGVPAAAHGLVTVGLGDQNASAFADPRLRALHLPVARLVVPYDAATSEPQVVAAWLAATSAAGIRPHIAFEHLRSDRCPDSPCTLPGRAAYAADVRDFIRRFPQVTTYTTWNEANHRSQPVATHPVAAAGYYAELHAACPRCTIVAGDVLDSGDYTGWLRRFRAATKLKPRLWGLHNYADATYRTSAATNAVLRAVPGELWIEETGGIVSLSDSNGDVTLPYDEARAAASVDWAFALLANRPRITRMYLYQWRGTVGASFDSGLARPDGSLRPSYGAVQRGLARRRSRRAVRWTAGWSGHRGAAVLVVRARCLTAARRCAGSVRVTVLAAGVVHRLKRRAYATSQAHPVRTLRVPVSRALRSDLRRTHKRTGRLRIHPRTPAAAAYTLALALPRPP